MTPKTERKERARELGFRFEGEPGPGNAITDVPGVEVGYATLIRDGAPARACAVGENGRAEAKRAASENRLRHAVRTGVTAILPRGHRRSAVFAGRFDLNGNGELTGSHWIDDSGFLHGPVLLTNTNSVGTVRDAASKWMLKNGYFYPSVVDGKEVPGYGFLYPAVGETYDGMLNDINGFHVTEQDVFQALDRASGEPPAEGNVGGGTGMRCFGFKGGTGTTSRAVTLDCGLNGTLGVLVQANFGIREDFAVRGIPFGKLISGADEKIVERTMEPGDGSIIVVLATDFPLLPHQLGKLSRRAAIGIGLLGGGAQNGSGDIFLAFSTANEEAFSHTVSTVRFAADEQLDAMYRAVPDAVSEAVLNALAAAESMTGRSGNFSPALPHGPVRTILNAYHEAEQAAGSVAAAGGTDDVR